MDGVITDFDKRFVELHGVPPGKVQGAFTKSEFWEMFVKGRHFETLEWFHEGKELFKFLSSFGIPMEILSSSGGEIFYEEITEHKTSWLRNNNINIPVNIVPGKRYKKDFAHEHHLLIDDTHRNVVEFKEAGGKAILHQNLKDTMEQVYESLYR